MSNHYYNITEAAKKLNVSTRTVRRYIKSGKIRAELINGNFGEEYRITELPSPVRSEAISENGDEINSQQGSNHFNMQLFREFQEKNLALAAQLGAAAERIKYLEKQLKLLSAPANKLTLWTKIRHFFSIERRVKPDVEFSSNERAGNE